jgi:hypothetical protein
LWSTTTEGHPLSPVFETLEALCAWAADNATVFADTKATYEQWYEMLSAGHVYHQEGNFTFI